MSIVAWRSVTFAHPGAARPALRAVELEIDAGEVVLTLGRSGSGKSTLLRSVNGLVPHLNARDVTMLFVSQASLEKLQAYKRRMGWSFPWVSSANTDFNVELGFSSSEEQTREWVAPARDQLPPIAEHNAGASGTDLVGYLTELFGFSAFARDEDGVVYHTYSTTGRGIEFLMGYYPILDHAPKGRDEGEAFQVWIRRHDEYGR